MITKKAMNLAASPDLTPQGLRAEMKALGREIRFIQWLSVWRLLVGGDERYQAIYRRHLRALTRRMNAYGQAWTWWFWHHA